MSEKLTKKMIWPKNKLWLGKLVNASASLLSGFCIHFLQVYYEVTCEYTRGWGYQNKYFVYHKY